jgi:precorrin-4/cobalt-precorrin-4 C11-methyltransferase
VLFVGAGPGDPDLITVKGRRALRRADTVVYAGSLVPETLLQWARPEAQRINSAGLTLAEIVQAIQDAWQAGKRVVRLHTGDPSLYGAISEQMAALDQLEIPYRVIPGVTAAFAAAAAMGIEFTLPEVSQTLILTRCGGRTPVPPTEDLAALAAHGATMAIYLSVGMIDKVVATLQQAYGPAAPCAVVYRASQPDEIVLRDRLDRIAVAVRQAGIDRQAVIIVGRVLSMEGADPVHRSKLYDARFSHGCRDASQS